MHLFSADKYANEQKTEEAPAMKAKLSLNKLAMDRLTILFHKRHAINLQGWPVSDCCWMSKLDEVNGLNIGKVYGAPKSIMNLQMLLQRYSVMRFESIWATASLFQ